MRYINLHLLTYLLTYSLTYLLKSEYRTISCLSVHWTYSPCCLLFAWLDGLVGIIKFGGDK